MKGIILNIIYSCIDGCGLVCHIQDFYHIVCVIKKKKSDVRL